MRYELTIRNSKSVIGHTTAMKLTQGVPVPLEGMELDATSHCPTDPEVKKVQSKAFIKPIL